MNLAYAILGFLDYEPLTGYELKREFDESIRHFWPADQSQIYKTLSRLSEQGLIEVEVVQQEGRPNRKVYHITCDGRAEFRRWLASPPAQDEIRHPFLIRVFFAGKLSDAEAIALFEKKADEARSLLDICRSIGEGLPHEEDLQTPARERFFWYLTLDYSDWMVRAGLDWLEHTLERIRSEDHNDGRPSCMSDTRSP